MNSIEEEEECNGIIMNVHINYIIMRSSSSSRRMRYRADDAFDRDSEYISLQISTQQRDRKSDLSSPVSFRINMIIIISVEMRLPVVSSGIFNKLQVTSTRCFIPSK